MNPPSPGELLQGSSSPLYSRNSHQTQFQSGPRSQDKPEQDPIASDFSRIFSDADAVLGYSEMSEEMEEHQRLWAGPSNSSRSGFPAKALSMSSSPSSMLSLLDDGQSSLARGRVAADARTERSGSPCPAPRPTGRSPNVSQDGRKPPVPAQGLRHAKRPASESPVKDWFVVGPKKRAVLLESSSSPSRLVLSSSPQQLRRPSLKLRTEIVGIHEEEADKTGAIEADEETDEEGMIEVDEEETDEEEDAEML